MSTTWALCLLAVFLGMAFGYRLGRLQALGSRCIESFPTSTDIQLGKPPIATQLAEEREARRKHTLTVTINTEDVLRELREMLNMAAADNSRIIRLEKEKKELLKARSALLELVYLKKYKDLWGKDAYYIHKQPMVWEQAKEIADKA